MVLKAITCREIYQSLQSLQNKLSKLRLLFSKKKKAGAFLQIHFWQEIFTFPEMRYTLQSALSLQNMTVRIIKIPDPLPQRTLVTCDSVTCFFHRHGNLLIMWFRYKQPLIFWFLSLLLSWLSCNFPNLPYKVLSRFLCLQVARRFGNSIYRLTN